MRRKVNILISDLRSRAAIRTAGICIDTNDLKFLSDAQLMDEAANRLQAIEVLEKELEDAYNLIDELRDTIASYP